MKDNEKPQTGGPNRTQRRICPVCGRPFWMAPRGRPKLYCGAHCRVVAFRQRQEALAREAAADGAVV